MNNKPFPLIVFESVIFYRVIAPAVQMLLQRRRTTTWTSVFLRGQQRPPVDHSAYQMVAPMFDSYALSVKEHQSVLWSFLWSFCLDKKVEVSSFFFEMNCWRMG
jgi:hypothetical protein